MEQDVRHLTGLLAGKSDPEESGLWLPLWMHARDTAYVFCRRVQNWISQSIRDAIGLENEVLMQVAYFLGLVHDIGKATSLFQKQILLQIPEAYERLNAVLSFRAEYRNGRETRHACATSPRVRGGDPDKPGAKCQGMNISPHSGGEPNAYNGSRGVRPFSPHGGVSLAKCCMVCFDHFRRFVRKWEFQSGKENCRSTGKQKRGASPSFLLTGWAALL